MEKQKLNRLYIVRDFHPPDLSDASYREKKVYWRWACLVWFVAGVLAGAILAELLGGLR